jgi:hypothetical protein
MHYTLYLYFLGLSFRHTSKAIQPFEKKGSHIAISKWAQRLNPKCGVSYSVRSSSHQMGPIQGFKTKNAIHAYLDIIYQNMIYVVDLLYIIMFPTK